MPGNFRFDAVDALRNDIGDPLEVIRVVGEKRQPRSQIFDLQIFCAGGHQLLHLRIKDRRQFQAQFFRIFVVLVVNVPGEIDGARTDRNLDGFRRAL